MAKRRATSSDQDDDFESASPKRSRADNEYEEDDSEAEQPVRKSRKSKGKSRAQATDEDETEGAEERNVDEGVSAEDLTQFPDDYELVVPDAAATQRWELENADRIRSEITQKVKAIGRVAEFGVIQSIELIQFMCHPKLFVNFGPKINFVIGHNGSGKSAILTGLVIALGGKANVTGRGTGLKSFIKRGEDRAQVTVRIKNGGEEAYKPDTYGQSIIIQRSFSIDGSSSYKIKASDGRTISTKREELSNICDHMNIQVDNPLNVLTQDNARAFLSSTDDKEKYKLFLKGTQLTQLMDEYNVCMDNITKTQTFLKSKISFIPDLEKQASDAKMIYREATEALRWQEELKGVNRELAWAHVASKRQDCAAKEKERATRTEKVARAEENITEAETALEAAQEFTREKQLLISNGGEEEQALEGQRGVLKAEVVQKRNALVEHQDQKKRLDQTLRRLNREIEQSQQNIDSEVERLAESSQHQRAEREQMLQDIRDRVAESQQAIQNVENEKSDIRTRLDGNRFEGDKLKRELDDLKRDFTYKQQELDRLRTTESHALDIYGNSMRRVLEEINGRRWHGDVPLGPLGQFITLKDERWKACLQDRLGPLMCSFAITDSRDFRTLKQILERYRNPKAQVFVSRKDFFDYTSGEPNNPNVPTVLRQLEFIDPEGWVKRIFITQLRIERVVLFPTRENAQNHLRDVTIGGRFVGGIAWAADYYTVQAYPEGGISSESRPAPGQNHFSRKMFTVADPAVRIRKLEEDLPGLQSAIRGKDRELEGMREKFIDLNRRLPDLERRENYARREYDSQSQNLELAQSQNVDELPATISSLQAAHKELEDTVVAQLGQSEEMKRTIDAISAELTPKAQELDVIRRRLDELNQDRYQRQAEAEDAKRKEDRPRRELEHYNGRLTAYRNELQATQAVLATAHQELEAWSAEAAKVGDEFENPRPASVLVKEQKNLENALKERARRSGISAEEATLRMQEAGEALETARHELNEMQSLNNALKHSMAIRVERWYNFRQHIALRTKLLFQQNLSNRGFDGSLIFDHEGQKLTLKVQTEDQVSSQAVMTKEAKSLSGGEKSFSTISLLLSLWEAIGCPIRCLDEFDVFMDAVNRRISMKMMIDSAKSSDRQYVLITPQDMAGVQIDKTINVHRLADPRRDPGQQTLNFNN